MTQLTNQQIFDKALFGIRKQGYKASIKGGGACLYRYVDYEGCTLSCAVGHCIPDDVAKKWDSLPNHTYIEAINQACPDDYNTLFSIDSLPFLQLLQDAHDNVLDSSSLKWEEEMESIATAHGLEYTPLGESK